MRIKYFFLLVSVIYWAAPANAQVYKCQIEGKTVYNQTPCGVSGQEMRLETRASPPADGGLRESETRMLEQIQAREREQTQRRQESLKSESDTKRRLQEVQADAAADARGRECAKKSSKLIELEQKRDDSHSVSEIRDLRDQMERLQEAMSKLGCE